MIKYIKGDIFKSPAKVIVNTVNTVGVMGKGIALEYKNRYPNMFSKYKDLCDKKKLKVGDLMLCNEDDHQILLFPTKENWRAKSKIEYIEKGLKSFVNMYADLGIFSIAFPKLGCGNGGLDWKDVKVLMEKYLQRLPIEIYIYVGTVKKESKSVKESKNMVFSGVLSEIAHACTIEPVSCEDNWVARWDYEEKVIFSKQNDSHQTVINKDEIWKRWDEIKIKKIIKKKYDSIEKELIDCLFCKLGYLEEVEIDENGMDVPGYQFDSGAGRVFYLNEGVPKV